jgi:hypothetical protein
MYLSFFPSAASRQLATLDGCQFFLPHFGHFKAAVGFDGAL